jgi:hypothetical protein
VDERPPRALILLLLLTAAILSAAVLGSSTEAHDTDVTQGVHVEREHAIVACVAVDPGTLIAAPDFVGMDVVSAMQQACDRGLKFDWDAMPKQLDTVVLSQQPKAGTPIRTGDTVQLSAR